MKTMTDAARTVAANAVSTNVLAGKDEEFLGDNSMVRLYSVASAAGLHATFVVGDRIIINDQEISPANRFPTRDQDLLGEAGGAIGDRLSLTFRNGTGGALTVDSLIDVVPV